MTIISQIYRGNRYFYFSEVSHEFPENEIFKFLKENTKEDKSRFISMTFSKITSNIPTYYELYFPEGVDAMYPIWYGEFESFFIGKDAAIENISRIDVNFSDEIEFIRDRWKKRKVINLLSHLGIRYLIIPKDDYHLIPPEPEFVKVYNHKWHTIYEYKFAFPRAYFVSKSVISNDKTLTLQRIFHPSFFSDPEVVVANENIRKYSTTNNQNNLLESNIDLVKKQKKNIEDILEDPYKDVKLFHNTITENPIQISLLENNNMVLKADVKEDGFIVTSDSYFPGWQANVDGKPATIYRANHAFRAVPVTKGQHEVTFSYTPKAFYKGAKVSIVSGITVVIILLSRALRKYRLKLK